MKVHSSNTSVYSVLKFCKILSQIFSNVENFLNHKVMLIKSNNHENCLKIEKFFMKNLSHQAGEPSKACQSWTSIRSKSIPAGTSEDIVQ